MILKATSKIEMKFYIIRVIILKKDEKDLGNRVM